MNKALRRALKGAVFSFALIGLTATQASAQLTPQQQAIQDQQGIANPGRTNDRLLGQDFVPRVTPNVEVKKARVQGAPEGAERVQFELGGIIIDGVTVYPAQELRAVYGHMIGETITLADLYGIAGQLTRKYRNEGYILTQVVVPPQTIEGGIARLQVVEGTIDNIQVSGPNDKGLDLIRQYASRIKVEGALNSRDLERALLLINDIAGVSARGVLNPSPTKAGAADLLILVERKDYDAQIGIDNHGTRFLGPVQLSAAGSLNSYFDNNERITGQFVLAPDFGDGETKELVYGSILYDQPIGPYGTRATLAASHTHTEPGYTLQQFNVKGWSTTYSAQVEHPFVRSRTMNVSGRAKFDYREITTKNNIPIDPARKDHIRAVRLGGTVEILDSIFGVAYNIADVQISKGMDMLGSNHKGQANMSRPTADPTFLKMNAELQRLQRVSQEINLLLGVKGQWSRDALLSSEEFGVGGQDYGRGFDPSEIIGDEGLAGKIELQWTEPYELSLLETYQLYGFFDAGRIWDTDSTTLDGKIETLTSTGFGIRADFNEVTNAGLMVAFPLNNTPQTQSDRDPRVFVNLNRRF